MQAPKHLVVVVVMIIQTLFKEKATTIGLENERFQRVGTIEKGELCDLVSLADSLHAGHMICMSGSIQNLYFKSVVTLAFLFNSL